MLKSWKIYREKKELEYNLFKILNKSLKRGYSPELLRAVAELLKSVK
ncbi:hypothetical protein ACUW9N_002207 [Staphylococcus auricularis]|uniref:Uncharacterized protein n=1 Tax=Staphylococcus auricularis TaxID=29379 RepID=A0AAW7MA72_9STAP|nr:hypothetical protein [Staphylococcus auricularis]MCG7342347.1 hypothetical protein [Staphylococcus auricularis]MDC6328254.1 hypothetical protein [Staphylococcus auricularis]MDN4532155.1 hypothetical protein [Staphylococcus auricularis]